MKWRKSSGYRRAINSKQSEMYEVHPGISVKRPSRAAASRCWSICRFPERSAADSAVCPEKSGRSPTRQLALSNSSNGSSKAHFWTTNCKSEVPSSGWWALIIAGWREIMWRRQRISSSSDDARASTCADTTSKLGWSRHE